MEIDKVHTASTQNKKVLDDLKKDEGLSSSAGIQQNSGSKSPPLTSKKRETELVFPDKFDTSKITHTQDEWVKKYGHHEIKFG